MSGSRLLALPTLALALVAPTLIVVAPASAQIDPDSRISDVTPAHRQPFSIRGGIVNDGTDVPCAGGRTTLFRIPLRTEDPQVVGTDADGGTFSFDLTATVNAYYYLHHTGNDTAQCAEDSGGWVQSVHRRMPSNVSRRGILSGAVKPAWRRKPVIVQVKKSGRWVTHDKVRTNRRSRYSSKVYARRGRTVQFRAFVKGTPDYVKSYTDTWDVFYERSAARVAPSARIAADSATLD